MYQAMNYLAWAVSIALLAWMVFDALRVETTYDRDVLVSSVEGEIEKEILLDESIEKQPTTKETGEV